MYPQYVSQSSNENCGPRPNTAPGPAHRLLSFDIFSFYHRTSEIITFYIELLSLQTFPFLGGLSCFIFLGLQVARTTRRRCTSKAESFSDMSATPITCIYSNHSHPDQMYGHQILITRSRERNTTISKGRGGRVAPMPAHLDEVGHDRD